MDDTTIESGTPGSFWLRLRLHPDPEHGEGATEEMALSWGELELHAGGLNLTAHIDRDGTEHESIFWYLAPLCQWLAAVPDAVRDDLTAPVPVDVDFGVDYLDHWLAPEGLPEARAEKWEHRVECWRQRHALTSARHGGVVPEIAFRRVDDDVEISWDPALAPDCAEIRFTAARGAAVVSIGEFQATVAAFRSAAGARLPALGEVARLPELDEGRALLSRLRRALPPEKASLVEDAHQQLGPLGLCAQTLDPELGERDAARLAAAAAKKRTVSSDPLIDLHQPEVGQPFAQGNAAALALRKSLDLNGHPLRDLTGIFKSLGVSIDEVSIADATIRSVALAGVDLGAKPVVCLNATSDFNAKKASRRASLLQGLGHLLLHRSRANRTGFAHGSRWGLDARSARANSFAATMLAPPDALVDLKPTRESVANHSRKLNASPHLIIQQARNLHIFDGQDARMLLEEMTLR